jgi:hypothetical protein
MICQFDDLPINQATTAFSLANWQIDKSSNCLFENAIFAEKIYDPVFAG